MPSPPDKLGPWVYMGRYKVRLALGVVLLLLTNVLFLGIPVVLGMIVNALLEDPSKVPTLCLWIVGFAAAQALVRIASRLAIFNAARMAEYDLRGDLFGHLLGLEPGYYRTHSTGDVMSRLTNDVQTVRAMWGAGILQIANTTFAFATVLVMMVRIDPVLTLWAALPYPAMALLGRFVGRRIYRASRDVQAQLGRLSSSVQEDLTGINIIKTYTLEEQRTEAFDDSSRDLLSKNMVVTKIRGSLGPLLTGLASLGTVVVLWIGGKAVINGRIDLGQLIEFNSYLARLVWPTLALGWMLSLFQRGLASWGRLAEILETEPAIRDGDGPDLDPAAVRGRVEVRDLTLEADDRTILDRVSITMPAGSVTAVVGRTGAGKSTLVDAMCRLVEVPRGAVFLDGHDVTELPLDSLRGSIGYAPQDAFLFSTTIRDNILFGVERRDPKGRLDRDAEVRRAALAAGLTADLDAFPAGYETVVGERGITLSGGQRQRVALARALATAPKVLLLDDSLSSVDAETEREILEHLGEHLAGRTALLISHRVAAVRRADQIVVLDEGRVVETGTHEQLLAAGGLYADLYQSQLADLPDESPHEPTETAERAGGDP